MKIDAKLMADLFDGIPAGENLQGDTSEWEGVDKKQDSTTPFKDKVAYLHATIEAEPIEPEPDNEEAVMPKKSSVQSKSEPKGKQEKPPVSDSKEQENQVLTPSKPPQEEPAGDGDPEDEESEVPPEEESEPEPVVNEVANEEEVFPPNVAREYKLLYEKVKQGLPKYALWDGSQAYASFYRVKLEQTCTLYKKFGLPLIKEWRDELDNVQISNFVGETEATADLIRKKLDVVQQHRTRLATIRYQIVYRIPSWKRIIEMLRGKLFKDHESRGQHKRDGMCLEHMGELEEYLADMEGVEAACRYLDELLVGQSESLSRQFACININNPSGYSYHDSQNSRPVQSSRSNSPRPTPERKNDLDEYDEIAEGEEVGPPKEGRPLPRTEWSISSDDDPLSKVGTSN